MKKKPLAGLEKKSRRVVPGATQRVMKERLDSYLLSSNFSVYTNPLAVPTKSLITHNAGGFSEEGIISSHPNVNSGMYAGSELTNQNVASFYDLASEDLHAAPLTRTIATITA
jgi:hypothetical protein